MLSFIGMILVFFGLNDDNMGLIFLGLFAIVIDAIEPPPYIPPTDTKVEQQVEKEEAP